MTYKWSIVEVFLIDVLLLQNKQSKRIYEYMKQIASEEPEPIQTETSKQKNSKTDKIEIPKTDKTEAPKQDKSTSKHKKTPSIEIQNSVTEINEDPTEHAAEQITDIKTIIKEETKQEIKLNDNKEEIKLDNKEENDPEIENWKVGSKCEIYSKAATKWVEGIITEIYDDDEGEWLRVQYLGDKAKDVQRYSEFVRKIVNKNEVKNDDNSVGDIGIGVGKTWKNLIFNVAMHSVFDSWKIYDYSTVDDVSIQNIEQRLRIAKNGR
eukprot:986539_1